MGLYDYLSQQLHVSRNFVKHTLCALSYGASVDPWVKHLFEKELALWYV